MTEIAADRLKSFIERIESLEEDKRGIQESIKDVFKELTNEGFDKKAVREVLRLRKMKRHERSELEELTALYRKALGT